MMFKIAKSLLLTILLILQFSTNCMDITSRQLDIMPSDFDKSLIPTTMMAILKSEHLTSLAYDSFHLHNNKMNPLELFKKVPNYCSYSYIDSSNALKQCGFFASGGAKDVNIETLIYGYKMLAHIQPFTKDILYPTTIKSTVDYTSESITVSSHALLDSEPKMLLDFLKRSVYTDAKALYLYSLRDMCSSCSLCVAVDSYIRQRDRGGDFQTIVASSMSYDDSKHPQPKKNFEKHSGDSKGYMLNQIRYEVKDTIIVLKDIIEKNLFDIVYYNIPIGHRPEKLSFEQCFTEMYKKLSSINEKAHIMLCADAFKTKITDRAYLLALLLKSIQLAGY